MLKCLAPDSPFYTIRSFFIGHMETRFGDMPCELLLDLTNNYMLIVAYITTITAIAAFLILAPTPKGRFR